jgi:hypothetical protein
MISIGMNDVDRQIGALVKNFQVLEPRIARKHLGAAMRRTMNPLKGDLRKVTPPVGTRRGRRRKGEKPRSTGALRRAVAVKTKAKNDAVFGVLGYRGGFESRKAIWLEFGTDRGVDARGMVKNLMAELKPKIQARLPQELKIALERAAKDLGGPSRQGG